MRHGTLVHSVPNLNHVERKTITCAARAALLGSILRLKKTYFGTHISEQNPSLFRLRVRYCTAQVEIKRCRLVVCAARDI